MEHAESTETTKKILFGTIVIEGKGVFVAVSDYMKIVPEQISKWVPGGLMCLGTDGFGRSGTRDQLRDFEIDDDILLSCVVSVKAAWSS